MCSEMLLEAAMPSNGVHLELDDDDYVVIHPSASRS